MVLSIASAIVMSTGVLEIIFLQFVGPRRGGCGTVAGSEMARGVLRKIVKRTVDSKSKRQTCALECGHIVTRSTGQISARCYCPECSAPSAPLESSPEK